MFNLEDPPLWFLESLSFLQEVTRDREVMTEGQIKAYWLVLRDLPPDAVVRSVARLAKEHTYPTVPTAAAIRDCAKGGGTNGPPLADAWRLAREVSCLSRQPRRYTERRMVEIYVGKGSDGQYEPREVMVAVEEPESAFARARRALPEPVRRAGDAYGWSVIADSEPSVAFGQFRKCYESVLAGQNQPTPEELPSAPPAPVAGILDRIGQLTNGVHRG
jgi:hypothetical protein